MQKKLIALTQAAADQIKHLLAQRGRVSLGIRVGVKSGGCSGFKYSIEYADAQQPFDEVIHSHGVTVLIDPKALMYLIGTEMDYIESEFKAGFTFTNPNEQGKCGCGSSFSI